MKLFNRLYANYNKIVATKPIILNLTNYVTQDFIANSLLAIGSSPIMSEDQSELAELINIAKSINLNIGTLNSTFNQLALSAAITSQQLSKPLILDPVGAGATNFRTKLALQLAPYATIIRSNASEVMALTGQSSRTAGVDSRDDPQQAQSHLNLLSSKYQTTLVVSGKVDLIVAPNLMLNNPFGDPIMTKVTGMGCALSAVIAAFAAINDNYAEASYLAVTFYTLCAEQAKKIASSPAKFKCEFIDSLYAPDWEGMKEKLMRVEAQFLNQICRENNHAN